MILLETGNYYSVLWENSSFGNFGHFWPILAIGWRFFFSKNWNYVILDKFFFSHSTPLWSPTSRLSQSFDQKSRNGSFWPFRSKWHYETFWYFRFSLKMILFNGISIFLNIKMLWWPHFWQQFCIFGLKSLKIAVFDIVLSKRCYETSWYSRFSYKIVLFNGNFTF